jgi:hypothetical protein
MSVYHRNILALVCFSMPALFQDRTWLPVQKGGGATPFQPFAIRLFPPTHLANKAAIGNQLTRGVLAASSNLHLYIFYQR